MKYMNKGAKMACLTLERQKEIDNIITNISLSYDDDYFSPPVDVQAIAKGLDIEVFQTDLTKFPGKTSGMITYENPDTRQGPQAYLEKTMSAERQRFTLAHEIGHHIMHKGEKFRLDNLDYSTEAAIDESEANYFAASLLIPKDKLVKLIVQGKKDADLASFFQVSLSAIRNRIKWILNN